MIFFDIKMTTPSKYSINLMWINSKLNPDKPYITPHETEALFLEQVLNKVSKWKQANSQAEVNFWYDGHFTTIDALNRTKALLEKKANEDSSFQFHLKDIRQIEFVCKNADAFSDYISIYYRVDLLKLILCVNSIETDHMDAALFADLEVGDKRKTQDRIGKEELFAPDIMTRLESIGLQVNEDGIKDENQFFQILNKNNTLNAIKTYINACLARAITALNVNASEEQPHLLTDLCTSVFNMMSAQLFPLIEMLAYEQEVLIKASLFETNPTQEWIKYDLIKHGHLPLGNLYLRNYNSCFHLPFGANLTTENIVRKLIKFPELSYQHPFSRKGMETRSGGNHIESIENLIVRKPADGATYKYQAWPLNPNKAIESSLTAKVRVPEEGLLAKHNNDVCDTNVSLPNEQQRLIRDRYLTLINPHLTQLEKKISTIPPQQLKTIQKTSFLLAQLKNFRDHFLLELQKPGASLSKIRDDFLMKSEKAFSTTKKELQNDLNWVDYLTHFFKKCVKAIVSIFSNKPFNFFSPTKIDYIKEIETIDKELKQSSLNFPG